MKIRYLGPGDHVMVGPYGPHYRDQVKDYPRQFAEELLVTSVRQQFEVVGKGKERPETGGAEEAASLEGRTNADLIAMLEEKGIEIPKKARKAELIELLEKS